MENNMKKIDELLNAKGALSDDELDTVSGGAGGAAPRKVQEEAIRQLWNQLHNADEVVKAARGFPAITLTEAEIRALCR